MFDSKQSVKNYAVSQTINNNINLLCKKRKSYITAGDRIEK